MKLKTKFLKLWLVVTAFFVFTLTANTAGANEKKLKDYDYSTYNEILEQNNNDQEQLRSKLYNAMIGHVTFCKTRKQDGKDYETTVFLKACASSYGGCVERINNLTNLILETAKKTNIDPFFIAAMAYHESRFNPFAESPKRARGIMQVNSRNKHARKHQFFRNKKYWKQCKKIKGNCQQEVMDAAMEIFFSSLRECSNNTAAALSMYNTGKCFLRKKYIRSVSKAHESLTTYDGNNYLSYCDSVKENQRFWERKIEYLKSIDSASKK